MRKLDVAIVYLLCGYALCSIMSISLADIFFVLSLIVWIADIVINKKNIKTFFYRPAALVIGVFAVWHIICAFFGIDMLNSLKDTKKLYLMFMYFLAASYLNDSEKRRLALNSFAVGAAFIGIYASITGFYNREILHNQNFRAISFSGNHMHAGGMLMQGAVMTAGIVFYYFKDFKKNIKPLLFFVPAFVVICTGLLFTFTRGSWIAAFIGITVAALLINKKMLIAIVVVLLAAGVFMKDTSFMNRLMSSFTVVKGTSSSERVLMWKSGFQIIKDHPITGVGTANISKIYDKYKSSESIEGTQGHLHNNLIQIAAIDGIPGLIIFLIMFGVLITVIFKIYLKADGFEKMIAASSTAVVAAFFINGFFEYNFFSSQVVLLFWFLAGLGLSAGQKAVKDI